ncbi:hypothetical protein APHAL10511_007797 [Amanita phalloides]|nr:hypothetical protein APHAL10511_007797 [Amanita phalloides]
MISPVDSTIVAMTIQATLTGVYLVTFLLCLRWLVFSDDGLTMRKDIKWPMFIVTIVIFAFSVIDFVFSLKYVLLDLDSCKKRMLYAGIITNIVESLTAIIIDSVLIFRFG